MRTDNITLWKRIKSLGQKVHYQYWKACSMRKPFVNVILALALSIAIVASMMDFTCAMSILITLMNIDGWAFGITWIFYSILCIYQMSRFLGGNKKNAILPAFISSIFVWYLIVLFYILTMNPSSVSFGEEDDSVFNDIVFIIVPFIQALLLNTIYFVLIWAIMRIKKNGVSAWSLLQDSQSERSRFDKICIVIACFLWLIPAIVCTLPY